MFCRSLPSVFYMFTACSHACTYIFFRRKFRCIPYLEEAKKHHNVKNHGQVSPSLLSAPAWKTQTRAGIQHKHQSTEAHLHAVGNVFAVHVEST